MSINGKETVGLVPVQNCLEYSPVFDNQVNQGYDDEKQGFIVITTKEIKFMQRICQPVKQEDHSRFFLEQGHLINNTRRKEVPLKFEPNDHQQKLVFEKMMRMFSGKIEKNPSKTF